MSCSVLRDIIDKSFDFYFLSTNFSFAVYHAHYYIFVSEETNLTTVTSKDWAKSWMNVFTTQHRQSLKTCKHLSERE